MKDFLIKVMKTQFVVNVTINVKYVYKVPKIVWFVQMIIDQIKIIQFVVAMKVGMK